MSPMAYVPVKVSDYAAEGRSLFKGDRLAEAALADLRDHGHVVLDFTGVSYVEFSAALVLSLAVREAYPDIHHGSRDACVRMGTPAPDPALFFAGTVGQPISEPTDRAWDQASKWFETHLVAGTPCHRCSGRGKVVAEHVNHGCGFEDTIYKRCDVCNGVGILA